MTCELFDYLTCLPDNESKVNFLLDCSRTAKASKYYQLSVEFSELAVNTQKRLKDGGNVRNRINNSMVSDGVA